MASLATREDFIEYLVVRKSGLTNMMLTGNVELLSGLDPKVIRVIASNFGPLSEKFPLTKEEQDYVIDQAEDLKEDS